VSTIKWRIYKILIIGSMVLQVYGFYTKNHFIYSFYQFFDLANFGYYFIRAQGCFYKFWDHYVMIIECRWTAG
jgi:hypothetical protein